MSAIAVHALDFAYNRRKQILKNLSFILPSGSIAGLLGANGTGKSTLLQLLSGLLYPSAGDIQVLGSAPSQRGVELLQKLYFLPEEISLPDTSVTAYISHYHRFYPAFDQALMNSALQRMELNPRHRLHDYSFGQRKKFLICFALATRTQLLILDEPTNGLDIPSKEQFRELLLETRTDEQSVVISTHQAHDLEGLIDRVILMDADTLLSCDLNELTGQLSVGWYRKAPADALYCRRSVNQWQCLTPWRDDGDAEMDLELLFTTFHTNKAQLQQFLSCGGQSHD